MRDSMKPADVLTDQLERLRRAWVASSAPIAGLLADGRSEDDTRSALQRAGVKNCDEIVSWFGWHDGYTAPPGSFREVTQCGIGSFMLMSFDDCLSELARWRELSVRRPGLSAEMWATAWFPLLRGLGGEVALVVPDGQSECSTAYYDPEFGCLPATNSLADLVARWARHIEHGVWKWEQSAAGGAWVAGTSTSVGVL